MTSEGIKDRENNNKIDTRVPAWLMRINCRRPERKQEKKTRGKGIGESHSAVNHGDSTLLKQSPISICSDHQSRLSPRGVSRCPGSFPAPGGAEKGAYNQGRPASSINKSPPLPIPGDLEVQPGCTGCRVHPRCTKALASIIDQDVEYSRGAEGQAQPQRRGASTATEIQ